MYSSSAIQLFGFVRMQFNNKLKYILKLIQKFILLLFLYVFHSIFKLIIKKLKLKKVELNVVIFVNYNSLTITKYVFQIISFVLVARPTIILPHPTLIVLFLIILPNPYLLFFSLSCCRLQPIYFLHCRRYQYLYL